MMVKFLQEKLQLPSISEPLILYLGRRLKIEQSYQSYPHYHQAP
jgi:hypothetical protein